MFLYKLPNAYEACVAKRPSKTSKTPYVADIILKDDDTNTEYMAHTASLGCCGLVEKDIEKVFCHYCDPPILDMLS